MLEWLRNNVRSFHWILWLVILTFVLGFVVMTPDFGSSGPGQGATAATVGGDEVTKGEFYDALKNATDQYRRIYGERFTPELAQQMDLPRQVLQSLVAKKIFVQEARRLGLTVTDQEVLDQILEIPFFTDENGKFVGKERYQAGVRQLGFNTPEAFEKAMREDTLVEKLNAVMAANVYVPDSAVEADYRRESEKARIRFVELPGSRFAGEVTVTPAEVQAHFDTRKEDYRRPEQRVMSYLLVNAGKLRSTIEVSPAEMESYYAQHKSDFTQEEQVQARHVLLKVDDTRDESSARALLEAAKRRIEGGADFTVVAKEMSEDPGSKDRGGDLGYFGRGKMIREFEDAAFGVDVTTLGQYRSGKIPAPMVGPIRTSFGLHLIQVLDRKPGGEQPLAQVQNQVRMRLQGEKAQQMAEERASALAARIKKEKLTSDEQWTALLTGADYLAQQKTQPFSEQDAIAQVGRVPELNAAVYALKVGEVTEAFKVPAGWLIGRLDEIKQPRVPELSEVEAQVRQALQKKKQEEVAAARLTLAKSQISDGKSLDAVAAELGLEVKDSGEFGHGQPITGLGANNAVTEAAMKTNAGATAGPIATRQGAVLFQVTERKSFDAVDFAKNKGEAKSRLEAQQVQRLLASLVESRSRELNARFDPELVESLGIKLPGSKKS